ncbi:LexA family transcriptional regulator [Rhodothalassium salexigens]|uniref:LexA family transcriptional regulator n=1 Tax=Rhodothalassium salexigens TaxID=1086 RepID=UPI001912093A|nr:LexA family transcriptional regulator [Rhodothalassium salexigens]MBK5920708.1 hypothetical protein [Rhodothalassium salexigens]
MFMNKLAKTTAAGRLRELRERANLSMEGIATAMGYAGASSYQRYENPEDFEAGLPLRFIKRLLEVLPGRGSPPISPKEVWDLCEAQMTDFLPAEEGLIAPETPIPDYVKIRQIPTYAGLGGGGNGDGDEMYVLFPRHLVESELRAHAENLMAIQLRGDSMSPTLLHGDQVLFDTRDKMPTMPGIFVLWDGDGMVCKRVEKVPRSDPPRVRLLPDNPAYSTDEALAEEISIMGRVVWFGRRL